MIQEKECVHVETVTDVEPASEVCDQCVAMGYTWPDVRYCTVCGFVGCCDGAKGHHMIDHYKETGHPIIRPVDPREAWMWCYLDEVYVSP